MAVIVDELMALQNDIASHSPTLREKTAAAAFLAQFYNGIENILKRIAVFHDVELPSGETWHVELFQRFSAPSDPRLPELFGEELARDLAPYRRFRHVFFHSYSFHLEWNRMQEGVEHIDEVFSRFNDSLVNYLHGLDQSSGTKQ